MSGGYFDYDCFRISQFAEDLHREIRDNSVENDFGYAPNYNKKTIDYLKKSQKIIELAGKLAKEVEWLYSGDTGEETFCSVACELLEGDKDG